MSTSILLTSTTPIVCVKSVKADAASKAVEVVFDTPATEEKIKLLLAEINYPVASPAV